MHGIEAASLSCADCHSDTESCQTSQRHELRRSSADPSEADRGVERGMPRLPRSERACPENGVGYGAHRSNGKTVNPHDLPATETHQAITCTNCHTMHSEQTDLDGDAKSYCTSCHHADVFECYTCHQHS